MKFDVQQKIVAVLAILVMLIGVTVALLPQKVMQRNLDESQKVVNSKGAVQKLQAENQLTSKKEKPIYDFSKVSPISYNLAKRAPTTSANWHRGMIKIPSVHIRAVINEGVSDTSLISGAGTMKPNQQMGQGNYALAGHNNYDYGKNGFLFSTLKQINKGDNIYLTDFKKVYIYRANQKKIINDTDGIVINDDQVKDNHAIVTLITCYSPTHESHTKTRFMVQGQLISEYFLENNF